MELSHQGGAEAESLLRPDQRNAVVMPYQKGPGWEVGDGEKAPFLRNEPVKLSPAWEGSNLPNDTLNLKGVAMDLTPPKDRWNLIFLTLMLHGIGTLTAWNMFITATDYFKKYKLVDAPSLANNYLPYVGWASQIPNLIFSWFNIFVKIGGNLTTRIVWSLCIEVGIFVFTVVLAMVDSTDWPVTFFWLTMVSAFCLNAFNAVFQNSVYGVAARLPAKYTGAVVLGSNICGTLVVFLQWSSELFQSVRTSAIYYFIGGMFVLLMCFDTYFALPLNRFYRYHDTLLQRSLRTHPALSSLAPAPPARVPYCLILRQAAVHIYNIFIIFFVTLAIFPTVQSEIEPVDKINFVIKDQTSFTRFTCYMTFNLMAMIGNITASLWQFPRPRWLWVFTTARLAFIPVFLLCKFKPLVRTMPVLVTNDWVYWAAAVLMGWSSGHGSSLGMMYISGTVAPENAAVAGMIGGATLVTGIVAGITLSRFAEPLVTWSLWEQL